MRDLENKRRDLEKKMRDLEKKRRDLEKKRRDLEKKMATMKKEKRRRERKSLESGTLMGMKSRRKAMKRKSQRKEKHSQQRLSRTNQEMRRSHYFLGITLKPFMIVVYRRMRVKYCPQTKTLKPCIGLGARMTMRMSSQRRTTKERLFASLYAAAL
jgi:hypothetical protein